MAGTFPVTGIFKSITLSSNLSKIQTTDPTNVLFEKSNFQQFTFNVTTAPLTRAQMGQVMSFLSAKGNTETFSFPLPRPFSGGSFNSAFNGAYGDPPIAGQTAYTGGQTPTLNQAQAKGDTSVQFFSTASNFVSMSGTYDNSTDPEITGTLTFKLGDYIQFTNHGKLYQFISSDANFIADNFGGSGFSFNSTPTVNFFPALTTAVNTSSRMTTALSPTVRLVGDVLEFESGIDGVYELKFVLEEDL
jgi:hypothetical protein